MVDEKKIMEFITSDYSWEQIIYKIVAWEGLNPWDLDISLLSGAFVQYMSGIKDMDFKIPAKYVIIAAVLLRMKSDHLQFLEKMGESDADGEEGIIGDFELGESEELNNGEQRSFAVSPVTVPPKRHSRRRITINELVSALRKTLKTQERREIRMSIRKKINIKRNNITQRIESLYEKINDILAKIKKDEVKFSKLVGKWERREVVDTFLPLVYLDNNKKVACRQEEMFDEIYIKKRE